MAVNFGRAVITHVRIVMDQKWTYFSGYSSGLWLILIYNKGMNEIFADIWVPTFPFASYRSFYMLYNLLAKNTSPVA